MSGSRVFGHAVDVGGLGWVWYAKRGEQGRLSVGLIGVFVAENHYMPPKSLILTPEETRPCPDSRSFVGRLCK